jgi:hypothetical protein
MVRPPALPSTISPESVDAILLTMRQRMVECRCQEGKRPATVPSLPDRTYADEGWARNLARWRHLGNVPRVSRVQSVIHHRNVVYCSWRVRLAQLGAHQLIRCNVTFIQQ